MSIRRILIVAVMAGSMIVGSAAAVAATNSPSPDIYFHASGSTSDPTIYFHA